MGHVTGVTWEVAKGPSDANHWQGWGGSRHGEMGMSSGKKAAAESPEERDPYQDQEAAEAGAQVPPTPIAGPWPGAVRHPGGNTPRWHIRVHPGPAPCKLLSHNSFSLHCNPTKVARVSSFFSCEN